MRTFLSSKERFTTFPFYAKDTNLKTLSLKILIVKAENLRLALNTKFVVIEIRNNLSQNKKKLILHLWSNSTQKQHIFWTIITFYCLLLLLMTSLKEIQASNKEKWFLRGKKTKTVLFFELDGSYMDVHFL